MIDFDYRSLCAELVEKVEYTWGRSAPDDVDELLTRARAALAQPYCDPSEERRLGYLNGLKDCAHAALAQPMPMPGDAELRAALLAGINSFPPRHPEAEHLSADEYEVELEIRKARAVWNLSRRGIPTNNASQEDHE